MVRFMLAGRVSLILLLFCGVSAAQQSGSIRGMIYDKDFGSPLGGAEVSIAETGEKVTASDEGNFVFGQLAPGSYTLVFSKDGYARLVKTDVVVSAGQMTEVDASMSGDFTEMEEFVVQDMDFESELEGALLELPMLELRLESPAFLDAISSDFISQAGASDAASALPLVAGASIQEGKYAVVRGLPDRYVVSQMNGVRLPTADADKRAVQLDQFPAAAIDRIEVSKTFTPDQQGDASGGAVNLVLKGIPEKTIFKFKSQTGFNNRVRGHREFLSYPGGGVNFLGQQTREIQTANLGRNWDGAVGVSNGYPPADSKWAVDYGTSYELDTDLKIGGFGSFFYERESSFFKDGIDDKYWVEDPRAPMTPQYIQGTPNQGDFKTQLFDVTQGSEELKWGALGVLGLETENTKLMLSTMYTRVAEDVATLAQDTRGKEFFFPGYDRTDPTDPGNRERDAAPYLRTETLQYTERTTQTMQLRGEHTIPNLETQGDFFSLLSPKLDWTLSHSSADLYQPDKRQFGSIWWAESYNPGFPPYVPPSNLPEVHRPYKPAENFTLGNVQRIWKDIIEESDQYSLNLKFPFEQWSGDEGYLKVGSFRDKVDRRYNQDSFSNFNDNSAEYFGGFEEFWSSEFPNENHPITAADIDVDYVGKQVITAKYYMLDVPLNSKFKIIGGMRFEDTDLSIINFPEKDVTWIPPGAPGSVTLNPGDADVAFQQSDALPSLGFQFTPVEQLSLRGSYTETVARQTFKELTPIQQQEFLGGDVFIGNPFLQMSALKNYDLRFDYTPYKGGLVSVSYFYKDVTNPIEYVQRIVDFVYTTPVNYPKGMLNGYELEVRQNMERFSDNLKGLTIGANATFINSGVTLPEDEAAQFEGPNIDAPMAERDMTNTPEHLYNLFFSWELDELGFKGTEVSMFYTVRGDTLVAGAGQSKGNFVPDVYDKEYGTLNLTVSKKFAENWNLRFQAKNILDPRIERVYRSDYIEDDVVKTAYRKGIGFTIALSAEF